MFQGKKDPRHGGVYIDKWHLPGGGTDEGETLDHAVIREVLEETGIDITPYERVLIDELGGGESQATDKATGEMVLIKMTFNVFEVTIHDKNADEIAVHLNDDLAEFKWVAEGEFDRSELTPPSITLFERLGYLPKETIR